MISCNLIKLFLPQAVHGGKEGILSVICNSVGDHTSVSKNYYTCHLLKLLRIMVLNISKSKVFSLFTDVFTSGFCKAIGGDNNNYKYWACLEGKNILVVLSETETKRVCLEYF